MKLQVLNPENKLVWQELWDSMKHIYEMNYPEWVQTTSEMNEEMLNVLPPRNWIGPAFLVGEPWRHTSNDEGVYACFYTAKDPGGPKFFARYMTNKQFVALFGVPLTDH